jgi:NADPH:quinone reductase-like Zn-dependent oxidoreductase
MKAVQINKYGGYDVLELNDKAPAPVLTKSQILVEVFSASINSVDIALRSGYFKEKAVIRFPATLGGDFSGIVVSGDSEFKKGDEVYGNGIILNGSSGSFADLVAVNSANVALKPKKANSQEAASLPLSGISAYEALEKYIKVSKGKKILIHGGAGGIGSLSIQLAKSSGAFVATTVKKKNIEYVKKLGADLVIDYENENFEFISKDFDAVIDTVGGETTNRSCQVLKKGGIIVSLIEKPAPELLDKYDIVAIKQNTNTNTLQLKKLSKLFDSGRIKAQVDKVFPIVQAKDAFKYFEEAHPCGKVVIKVKGELIGKINEVLSLSKVKKKIKSESEGEVQVLPI